jgi:hypothetical protein
MSSTCGIISQYCDVISDRSINNNALACNMQRLSSVCKMVPDGHIVSSTSTPSEKESRLNSDVANEIDFSRCIYIHE